MATPDDYRARIGAAGERLTPAERRVATTVLDDPRAVGFGTVAELADRAGVGVGTVVRLADRLGYRGFTELQRAVRRDLARQLRPAVERIRDGRPDPDAVAGHIELQLDNVRATLEAADPGMLARVADRLADVERPVAVLSGDASTGVARHLLDQLTALRPGVVAVDGNAVAVARTLAVLPPDATLLVVDLRRYDRWVVDTARDAAERGWSVVAVTDGELSPLAAVAADVFVVTAASLGPFDSHVGTLALGDLLVAMTARRLAASAAERLDAVERQWQLRRSLTLD